MSSGDFRVAVGGKYMDWDQNEIAKNIAQCQDEINDLRIQIQQHERWIAELMGLCICNDEGNVISFADWNS